MISFGQILFFKVWYGLEFIMFVYEQWTDKKEKVLVRMFNMNSPGQDTFVGQSVLRKSSALFNSCSGMKQFLL